MKMLGKHPKSVTSSRENSVPDSSNKGMSSSENVHKNQSVYAQLIISFYRFHGYLNKYLKLTQDGKNCRSPFVGEGGGFDVVAKINILFDTIVCYVVGEVYVFQPGEDVPTHYVFQSLHVDTTNCTQGTCTSIAST